MKRAIRVSAYALILLYNDAIFIPLLLDQQTKSTLRRNLSHVIFAQGVRDADLSGCTSALYCQCTDRCVATSTILLLSTY